jgi:hypothetical protein
LVFFLFKEAGPIGALAGLLALGLLFAISYPFVLLAVTAASLCMTSPLLKTHFKSAIWIAIEGIWGHAIDTVWALCVGMSNRYASIVHRWRSMQLPSICIPITEIEMYGAPIMYMFTHIYVGMHLTRHLCISFRGWDTLRRVLFQGQINPSLVKDGVNKVPNYTPDGFTSTRSSYSKSQLYTSDPQSLIQPGDKRAQHAVRSGGYQPFRRHICRGTGPVGFDPSVW